eukprot:Colp12_sorted_trinity150504_noHs@34922
MGTVYCDAFRQEEKASLTAASQPSQLHIQLQLLSLGELSEGVADPRSMDETGLVGIKALPGISVHPVLGVINNNNISEKNPPGPVSQPGSGPGVGAGAGGAGISTGGGLLGGLSFRFSPNPRASATVTPGKSSKTSPRVEPSADDSFNLS